LYLRVMSRKLNLQLDVPLRMFISNLMHVIDNSNP